MAEGKLDLPDDLELATKQPPLKGLASGGNDGDKVRIGLLNVSKDQTAPDISIPLSPQWLYSKPTESKIGISGGYGERPLNSLSQGILPDSIKKDARRLDGSLDKKERGRHVLDGDNARSWRDEERDIGLLGRRERRKEGDRENEYRKAERRTDSISMRENADSRALSASDRWHEVASRNSGHESRRDSKWTSRWAPENKEKDNRMERKLDAEKEDPHGEKQSIAGGNHLPSETDSRDKWWSARHRQEGYSAGSAKHLPAPGFHIGRGQNLKGFNSGRGKLNFIGDLTCRPSAVSIGAATTPVVKNAPPHMNTFRYPRGRLLDIYRKHTIQSTFDTATEIFTQVLPITQSNILVPLAFVKPDSSEEAALDDIREGKIVSSETSYDSSRVSMRRVDICEIESQAHNRGCEANVDAPHNGMNLGGLISTVKREDAFHFLPGSPVHSEEKTGEKNLGSDRGHLLHQDFLNDVQSGAINSVDTCDVTANLPRDSNSLFDSPFIKEVPGGNIHQQDSNSEIKVKDQGTTALRLLYLDPQGDTQGPFPIMDIISWYDQGFFGTDLLVRLSDAPEGMLYRPLGEVMPELSLRPQSNSLANPGEQSESSRTRRNLETDASISEISSSLLINDGQWPPSGSDSSFKNHSEERTGEKYLGSDKGHLLHQDFLNDVQSGAINAVDTCDVTANLPDDSNSLFDSPFIKEVPGGNIHQQDSNIEIKATEQGTTALRLFYLDPQGDTQGPFPIVDIISWYDQGFFGTDLLVRLSDAPEGMLYRPLGEVMPELSLRPQSNSLVNPGEQSESSRTRRNLEMDASIFEISSSLLINDSQWPPSGSDSSFKNHVHSKIAEHDLSTGLPSVEMPSSNPQISRELAISGRQICNIFSGHDAEDILYSSKSASSIHNPLGRLANDNQDLSQTLSGHQILMSQTGQVNSGNYQVSTGNSVNPLGLSWSELEGTCHRAPLSNIPGVGEQDHILNPLVGEDSLFRHNHEDFSLKTDSIGDAWSKKYRINSTSNGLHNIMDASQLEHQLSGHFNKEQMLFQHFQQQQLQQQHLLSPHQSIHTTGSFREQLQGPEHHQRTMNQSIPDLEHLLQFQQQRHLQQLEQQQQQKFHHQMQLLQQQHQQQQNQLLLEQLLHEQLHDPGYGVSGIRSLRSEVALEEVLYRHRLLNELQPQAHHVPRSHDPALDQLIQAKYGHNLHREHHNELLDALPHSSHRKRLLMEQEFLLRIQQELLQAQQFAIPSRQHSNIEEERHAGSLWSVDKSGQFIRALASPHQENTSGHSQLDFIQPSQRPSSFNYPSNIERSLILHDQMQRGNYESNAQPFERSMGIPMPNKDLVGTLAHLQCMDGQERHKQMQSPGQLGQFSGSRSQQNWTPERFPASHLDLMERSWLGPRGQLQNTSIESQFTQLHHVAEKHKRDMASNLHMEDQTRWVGNDEGSHGLAEFFQQNMVLQSSQSSSLVNGACTQSYKNRDPSRIFSRPSKNSSLNHVADNISLGGSFADGSLFTIFGEAPEAKLEDRINTFENFGNSHLRLSSGNLNEQHNLLSSIGDVERERLAVPMANDIARDRTDFSDLKQGLSVKQHVSKDMPVSKPSLDSLFSGVGQEDSSVLDHRAMEVKGPVRHSSFGGTVGGASLHNYDMMADNTYNEEVVNHRVSGMFSKGVDISLSNHALAPDILSPHGALSELVPVPYMKEKNPYTSACSDEGMRELGVNMAVQVLETPSVRKEMRFRRTSSYSDAEASFIDMLKSTKKPAVDVDVSGTESTDAAKNSKKKGKKGRQIDPSLLGFKVHSNRMLMGEIHQPED